MKLIKKYWILILIAAITLAAILVYVFRCKLFPALASCVKDPNDETPIPPVPPGSATPKWVAESFPLNVGMFGTKTKKLQTALGIPADGKFGTQTKTSVIAKGKTVPLSQSDYDLIVTPPATGGGSNFQQLKTTLAGGAQNFSGGIYYLMQGINKNYRFDFYTNGRFVFYETGATVFQEKGSYYNGGKQMKVDSGNNYDGTAISNMTGIVKDYGA